MVKQFDRRVGTMIKKIKYAIIVMLIIANVICSSSIEAAEIFKVTNVKTREVTKTFKTIKDASLATTKLKYIAGYKISWKKQKKVEGYNVYVYYPATKNWKKIKTTKKNYFTLTNCFQGEKVKIKIRAYKKIDGNNVYGQFSKVKSIKIKKALYSRTKWGKIKKPFTDRIASENAFELQNKYRKSAGAERIEWSENVYNVCLERAKQISKNYSHDGWYETAMKVFSKKYKIDDEFIWIEEGDSEYGINYVSSENILEGAFSYKEAMKQWKGSSAHYKNLISKSHVKGAIACYRASGGYYWVALFVDADIDKLLEEKCKK